MIFRLGITRVGKRVGKPTVWKSKQLSYCNVEGFSTKACHALRYVKKIVHYTTKIVEALAVSGFGCQARQLDCTTIELLRRSKSGRARPFLLEIPHVKW